MMTEEEFEELTLTAQLAGYKIIWNRPTDTPALRFHETRGTLMFTRSLSNRHTIVFGDYPGDLPIEAYKSRLAHLVAVSAA